MLPSIALIFAGCHRTAFELLLTQSLRPEKTLVVDLIMLGQQAEVTADDDGSYLRQAFDAIDRGGPRLGGFPGCDSDKGNWSCLAGLRAARAQALNLLRIAEAQPVSCI